MKKVWKWVIGIVVVLVVVAVLVGGAFLLRNHFMNVNIVQRAVPGAQVPGGNVPFGNNDGVRRNGPGGFPGMMPYGNNGWGGRGMRMRGFGMMNPIFGIVGCFFGLIFLALVVLGIVWLVKSLSRSSAPAAVVTPAESVAPVVPAAPLVATHPCLKCGEPVQNDWKHCPNCGKRQ